MIRIGRKIQCLPYAGFFFNPFLALYVALEARQHPEATAEEEERWHGQPQGPRKGGNRFIDGIVKLSMFYSAVCCLEYTSLNSSTLEHCHSVLVSRCLTVIVSQCHTANSAVSQCGPLFSRLSVTPLDDPDDVQLELRHALPFRGLRDTIVCCRQMGGNSRIFLVNWWWNMMKCLSW